MEQINSSVQQLVQNYEISYSKSGGAKPTMCVYLNSKNKEDTIYVQFSGIAVDGDMSKINADILQQNKQYDVVTPQLINDPQVFKYLMNGLSKFKPDSLDQKAVTAIDKTLAKMYQKHAGAPMDQDVQQLKQPFSIDNKGKLREKEGKQIDDSNLYYLGVKYQKNFKDANQDYVRYYVVFFDEDFQGKPVTEQQAKSLLLPDEIPEQFIQGKTFLKTTGNGRNKNIKREKKPCNLMIVKCKSKEFAPPVQKGKVAGKYEAKLPVKFQFYKGEQTTEDGKVDVMKIKMSMDCINLLQFIYRIHYTGKQATIQDAGFDDNESYVPNQSVQDSLQQFMKPMIQEIQQQEIDNDLNDNLEDEEQKIEEPVQKQKAKVVIKESPKEEPEKKPVEEKKKTVKTVKKVKKDDQDDQTN